MSDSSSAMGLKSRWTYPKRKRNALLSQRNRWLRSVVFGEMECLMQRSEKSWTFRADRSAASAFPGLRGMRLLYKKMESMCSARLAGKSLNIPLALGKRFFARTAAGRIGGIGMQNSKLAKDGPPTKLFVKTVVRSSWPMAPTENIAAESVIPNTGGKKEILGTNLCFL